MKLIKSLQASLLGLVMVLYQVSAIAGVTYYHNDMLGSPVAATDEAGNVIWRANYYPYGDKETTDNAGNPVAPDNTRYYTGHEHDEETGLTYMQARYYDPVIGRFMGVDPVGFKSTNPASFNNYSYASNNPFRFTDPDGRDIVPLGGEQFNSLFTLMLEDIAESDPELGGIIDEMEESDNLHTVLPSPVDSGKGPYNALHPGENPENQHNGVGTGSETVIDLKRPALVNQERVPSDVVLVHELLGHGRDRDKGQLSRDADEQHDSAVSIENKYRDVIGLDSRKE